MKPDVIDNKTILIVGFGISGKSATRFFSSKSWSVYVSDSRSEKDLSAQEMTLLKRYCVDFELQEHSSQFIDRVDCIFLSPGVPGDLPLIADAEKKGIPVLGELALLAPELNCRIIAVTGTNGKTTVTTLIGNLLKASGMKPFVGGNIGDPLFELLMSEHSYDAAVVEVSSFQLERSKGFKPDIALLLNISPDHLDRHGTLVNYIRAKAQIFSSQDSSDFAIINNDNVYCTELADHLEHKAMTFGHSKDCNSYICEHEVYIRFSGKIEKYNLAGTVFANSIGMVNTAAAILAARYFGCTKEDIETGLRSFSPLPHRMEEVATINEVRYYNDSKATNTGAVISALQQVKGRVFLIAGGKDKGDDYSLLRASLKTKVVKVFLIGESSEIIAKVIGDVTPVEFSTNMEEAVFSASKEAESGDTVLLSPACASFDMYTSYGQRGEAFKESVYKIRDKGIKAVD